MSNVIGTVCFWTTGEFVTTTARDWFWAENKPYKKVEEFLLASMCGTDTPKAVLLGYVKDVLLGRRKFIGSTRDESYCLVDDDSDIHSLYSNMNFLFSLDDIERFLEANIRNQEYAEKRERLKEFWPDEYGWLSPSAEFYAVPWGTHQEWAYSYLEKHFTEKERYCYYKVSGAAGDVLVSRGWVLLHNPSQGLAQMTHSQTKPLTKAQKEYLYDYFLLRDRPKDANNLFMEEK